MASGIKFILLNDGHGICALTGTNFDGIITRYRTDEQKNKFVYVLRGDEQIEPTNCPLCQASLRPANKLGIFQRHESTPEKCYAG
jgi:hypothetical protein